MTVPLRPEDLLGELDFVRALGRGLLWDDAAAPSVAEVLEREELRRLGKSPGLAQRAANIVAPACTR